MEWIILIILAIIIFAFLKFEHYKRIISIFLLVILLLFVYFSMTSMIKNEKIRFDSPKAILNSLTLYFNWLGESILDMINYGKEGIKTTGNIIKGNITKKS